MRHINVVLTLFYAAVVQVPTIVFSLIGFQSSSFFLCFFPKVVLLAKIALRSSCGKSGSRLKILAISQITVRERQKLY